MNIKYEKSELWGGGGKGSGKYKKVIANFCKVLTWIELEKKSQNCGIKSCNYKKKLF